MSAETPSNTRLWFTSAWLGWTVLAVISWGIWAIIGNLIGEALSGTHSQALSTIGILPIMLALTIHRKPAATRQTRGVAYALAGGVLSSLGNVAYYHALSRGAKAAMLVPLTALYPLVTILLAVLLLRERLNFLQMWGLIVSLSAIYLFNVQDEAGFLSAGLVYIFAPILLWGIAGFLQKVSTNHISGELSSLCFLATFIPLAVLILMREPLPTQIAARVWWLVVLQGFFLGLGNLAILVAFAREGKASIIAPLAGLYPVVSVPIAILFLGKE